MIMGSRKGDKSEGSDDKSSPDYLTKRARNNEAVKRSREKSRQKANETHDRVDLLKKENEMLEERIKLLSKELTFLKDIFMAHAGKNHGICLDDLDIKALIKEVDSSEASVQSPNQ
ncbi:CCAAT/enhancer-binding protein homolog 2 [Lepeophtheirus salmonis]|uniref:CCAAT/enhancer-binding protein gamma n=1 Tax=Lepeophtheirus salmonis TaxID=72036 RepID=C1BSZ8_LEPSM|nr:CCAAT/enhancer-binding protein 2-like [Lepeophtheirus salmonis]ACO12151.1 CCAAT/enhancer-binding protein gamma [Lepeophtheirus salmonis]ACO12852.1 CCAAT/enhancer-binding protein gamma [Lepeophtheirus salmonis]